jgi:hypothetical protein
LKDLLQSFDGYFFNSSKHHPTFIELVEIVETKRPKVFQNGKQDELTCNDI